MAYLGAGLALLALLTPTLNLKGAHVSTDRTLNEIANNGMLAFGVAAWTHHLDYTGFYKTIDRSQAYARARRLLKEPNTEFVEAGQSIRRRVTGEPARPRLNVVIFLEESLGSEFWGCLGRHSTLTPEMDRLATERDCSSRIFMLRQSDRARLRGCALIVSAASRRFDCEARSLDNVETRRAGP